MTLTDAEPVIIEDLVKFGEERGEARGEARGFDRDVAQARIRMCEELISECLQRQLTSSERAVLPKRVAATSTKELNTMLVYASPDELEAWLAGT